MATKEYTKECKFCKEQIRMVENGGKWTAHNMNNGLHDCRDRDRPKVAEVVPQKQKNFNHKDVLSLADILKKLRTVVGDLEDFVGREQGSQ